MQYYSYCIDSLRYDYTVEIDTANYQLGYSIRQILQAEWLRDAAISFADLGPFQN